MYNDFHNTENPDNPDIFDELDKLYGISEETQTTSDDLETETDSEDSSANDGMEESKPKRTRKKKDILEPSDDEEEVLRLDDVADDEETIPIDTLLEDSANSELSDLFTEREMLKIRNSTIMSPEEQEEYNWHEVKNAYLTRRILKGTLSAIETTEANTSLAIIYYLSYRVVIPAKEFVTIYETSPEFGELNTRYSKILNNMIGCEVEFVIRGIENKSRSIVASRNAAMLRRRRAFYFNPQNDNFPKITEGQVVEARIIAVSERAVRVEAFGAECSIKKTYLSWEWIGNPSERYSVGDTMLIRIQEITGETPEDLRIRADAKSLTHDTNYEKLLQIKEQGKYSGVITDIFAGIMFIRLHQGVNAVAHSNLDHRRPGKNDEIGFTVTHIDHEQKVAVGIITRIIRQNII